MKRLALLFPLASLAALACDGSSVDERLGAAESASIADADAITRRADGRYDVRCRDGRTLTGLEVSDVTAEGLCRASVNDPFNPSSCVGAPMSRSEALARFKPGESSVTMGSYKVFRRDRTCNTFTGCGSWSDPSEAYEGQAVLHVDDAQVLLRLSGRGYSCGSGAGCGAVNGSPTSCGPYQYSSKGATYGCSYGGICGGYCETHDLDISFSGALTSSCLRLTASSRWPQTSAERDGRYQETEYVALSTY